MNDKNRRWIEHVFVDNELICGMWQDSLNAELTGWRQDAERFLLQNGGDHVIYCIVKYDDKGVAEYAHFCIDMLSDEDYRHKLAKETDAEIFAVHREGLAE